MKEKSRGSDMQSFNTLLLLPRHCLHLSISMSTHCDSCNFVFSNEDSWLMVLQFLSLNNCNFIYNSISPIIEKNNLKIQSKWITMLLIAYNYKSWSSLVVKYLYSQDQMPYNPKHLKGKPPVSRFKDKSYYNWTSHNDE